MSDGYGSYTVIKFQVLNMETLAIKMTKVANGISSKFMNEMFQ